MIEFLKEKYLNEEYVLLHKWRIICSISGFILALSFILLGFFATLLVALLVLAGYLLGNWKDRRVNPIDLIVSFFKW